MNSTFVPHGDQQQPPAFLIGTVEDNYTSFNTCSSAGTLIAWSFTHEADILCTLPCKRWGCRYCGPRRAKRLAYRCEEAKPNRFITLTIDPKLYADPRAAFDQTRRKLSDFSKLVRKLVGEFEYLRVIEVTKKGWPHYHLVARCSYIPQATISKAWAGLTGAPIVDIRRIEKQQNVFQYVMKYLCKQHAVPWTNRRVSWSGKFFPKEVKDESAKWRLCNRERSFLHPAKWAADNLAGRQLDQLTSNAYRIEAIDVLDKRELARTKVFNGRTHVHLRSEGGWTPVRTVVSKET